MFQTFWILQSISIPEEVDQLQSIVETYTKKLIDYSPQLIVGMIILITGFLLGSSLSKLILRVCTNRDINVTFSRLFASSIKLLIVLLFLFIAVRKIGVDISPFITLLSVGALGPSLAIQGPISNYGAGIAIILTRPFKVHDTLTLNGCTGIVSVDSITYTQLEIEDGQVVTIQNKRILGEILTNSFTVLVVEGIIGVDYASDPEQAIECDRKALAKVTGIDPDKSAPRNLEIRP